MESPMPNLASFEQKKWKQIGNSKYAIGFPDEWIRTEMYDHPSEIPEMVGTGPRYCSNCKHYGCDADEVFQAYCLNCADYVYEGKRGKGMGMEVTQNAALGVVLVDEPSAVDSQSGDAKLFGL